jgi:hypothetical protein
MQLANRDKVASYRESARRESYSLAAGMALAVVGYAGALFAGNSSIGWFCLVVAIAASFWTVFIAIHTQEQEQTAALLEYMIELFENAEKLRTKRGV